MKVSSSGSFDHFGSRRRKEKLANFLRWFLGYVCPLEQQRACVCVVCARA